MEVEVITIVMSSPILPNCLFLAQYYQSARFEYVPNTKFCCNEVYFFFNFKREGDYDEPFWKVAAWSDSRVTFMVYGPVAYTLENLVNNNSSEYIYSHIDYMYYAYII